MIEISKTDEFADWLDGLRDIQARGRRRDIKTALRLDRNLSE